MRSEAETPPLRRVAWQPTHRIIATRHPPVGVFDDIAGPEDRDALFELEGLTNPRLRDERGEIALVPPSRRISGPGASLIMAAFTHLNPGGSRFTDGSYGVYYAARELPTAIAETVHHRNHFLAWTREAACVLQLRCILADVAGRLHDLRRGYPQWHDPDHYEASQRAAARLREAGSDGLVYNSVRRPRGQCVAVFYPDLLGSVRQGPAILYHWDGQQITHATVGGDTVELAGPGGPSRSGAELV